MLCDRVVLKRLCQDLQNLASGVSVGEEVIDMQDLSLPSPSTASHSIVESSVFFQQDKLARLIFSICFAESCVLLLLFVCQLIDALDLPYAHLLDKGSINAHLILEPETSI